MLVKFVPGAYSAKLMDEFDGFPIADILPALNGRLIHGDPQTRFTSFCIDSRFVEEGTLFVPLMGQSRDGHHFIMDSLGKGAVASVVRAGHHQIHEILSWLHERTTRYGQQELADACIIEVRHTLIALQKVAEWWRKRHKAKVIGITGSVGKTGIKEMLIQMLSRQYVTIGTEKNFNNEIGVPLALSRLTPDCEMAVVEMAMRARGEISLLSRIAHPDIVMISNTSGSHVGRLGSFDEVYRAKCEVVDGLAAGGSLMLNRHDPNLPLILEELARRPATQDYNIKYFDAGAVFAQSGVPPFVPPVTLPEAPVADAEPTVWVEDYRTLGLEGSRFALCTADGRAECTIPLLGRGIAENFAAAALLALEAGMELGEIAEAGAALLPSPQRLQLQELRPGLLLIDDCYNSSPASVRDSLELLLSAGTQYRKIAVLGDMLELGKFETLLHRQIALTALNQPLDALVAVGPRMNAVNEVDARDDIELYYVEGNSEPRRDNHAAPQQRFGRNAHQQSPPQSQELTILDDAAADKVTSIVLDEIEEHPQPTVILIKGSRALHLERVVNDLLDRLG
jgi:UDP-N-acetylmuramoyl-tripeptide--D-alanyl-D-alanine ligase